MEKQYACKVWAKEAKAHFYLYWRWRKQIGILDKPCITKTDKALSGALFDHCMVITGASGGMLGAAYYRELYLRKNKASQLTFTTQNIPKTLVKIY